MAGRTEVAITAVDQTKPAFASVVSGLKGIESAVGGVLGLARSLPGLGVAIAGSLAAVKLNSVVNLGDEMFDMAQRTGIAVKQLASYKLAAEQSGASLGSIAVGVRGLSSAMLAHGAELKKLGFNTTDTDKALRQFADVFAVMPDGLEKSGLAVKAFGRSGLELIPLLNLGSKGLDESAEKSRKYAAAMALVAPQADKLKDSLAEMRVNSDALWASIGAVALPKLNEITAAMALAAEESGLLMAAWVGLGGIGKKFLFAEHKKSIGDLNAEIASLEQSIAKLQASGGETSDWLERKINQFSGKDQTETLKKQIAYVQELRAARDRLNRSEQAEKPATDDAVTARLKRQAEELRKIFAEKSGTGISKEDQAIESLTRQLEKASGETSTFDQTLERLNGGSWKEFGKSTRVQLLDLAGRIDGEKRLKAEIEGVDKILEKRVAAETRVSEVIETARRGQEEQRAAMAFEVSLAGQSEETKKRAQALRQIDLELEKGILAVKKQLQDLNEESGSNPELDARMEEFRRNAEAAKAAYSETADVILARTKDWRVGVSDAMRGYADEAEKTGLAVADSFRHGAKLAEDAIAEFVVSGKLDLASLARFAAVEAARETVAKPFVSSASEFVRGLFSNADGGAYASADLAAYANTIVRSPTLFRFARGGAFNVGLFGESGAEAIMPLRRGPDGRLGVQANADGTAQTIHIEVINPPGSPAQVERVSQRVEPRGLVVSVVLSDLAMNGPISQGMSSRFGLRGTSA